MVKASLQALIGLILVFLVVWRVSLWSDVIRPPRYQFSFLVNDKISLIVIETDFQVNRPIIGSAGRRLVIVSQSQPDLIYRYLSALLGPSKRVDILITPLFPTETLKYYKVKSWQVYQEGRVIVVPEGFVIKRPYGWEFRALSGQAYHWLDGGGQFETDPDCGLGGGVWLKPGREGVELLNCGGYKLIAAGPRSKEADRLVLDIGYVWRLIEFENDKMVYFYRNKFF